MVERGPLFMSSTSFQNRMFSRLYSVRRKSSNSRNPCSSFTRLKKLMAHLLTRNSVGIFTLWQKLNVLWYLKCQQILNYITQQNMIHVFFKNLMRGRDKLHVTYLYERERESESSFSFLAHSKFYWQRKGPQANIRHQVTYLRVTLYFDFSYKVSFESQNCMSSETQGLDGSAAFWSKNGSYSWYCSFQVK